MTKPKISLVIPIYNAENYLRQCLKSIEEQTFTDFEVLLIDDGSLDSSGKICDEIARKDQRFKIFHRENHGVSPSRNFGIEQSTGEWICFIDADDLLPQNHLQSLQYYTIDNDLAIVGLDSIWMNGDFAYSFNFLENKVYRDRDEIRQLLNKYCYEDIFRAPWGKIFKRSIINENHLQFDTRLRCGEDNVFNFEYYALAKSIACINLPKSNYIYRRSPILNSFEKYKIDAANVIILRDKIFNIYFEMGIHNPKFEANFLFFFQWIEKYYLHKPDNDERRNYYKHPYQKKIEKSGKERLRFYDWWMYLLCKYAPHKAMGPLISIYLKLRS